jgi:diguanylate cyclase (GGDEF)-like protein
VLEPGADTSDTEVMDAAWLQGQPARRQARSWAKVLRATAVAVAVVGVVGSVLIAKGWQATVTRQRDERLDRTAASRTVAITSTLAHYENALQAERSLWFAVSGKVTREDFGRFVHTLQLKDRYRGLQSIGWREAVAAGDADAFVRAARADGEAGFAIRPSGRRPVYYVMRYGYSIDVFGHQLGLDARAIPSVRGTLERARETGETTITGRTTLAGDLSLPRSRHPASFELIVPVYENGEPPATAVERQATFRGWASGQFRADDFLQAALSTSQPSTGVELHDNELGHTSLAAGYPSGFRAEGPYVRTESFTFGGRRFVLRYAPLPGNPALTERTIAAPLVLGTGIAVSLLLGGLLLLLAQVGALYQQVGRLARTDALTGVANRRAWDDAFPVELARAGRSGLPLCVALIDLDRFKAYNDEYGHQAGDRLLKAAAAAWQGKLRRSDLLARYGGEEFAVLLPDCGLDSAMEIAERLRTAQPEGTCSIGLAAWEAGEGPTELVDRADRALYAAKEAGRDRCRADRTAGAASAAG